MKPSSNSTKFKKPLDLFQLKKNKQTFVKRPSITTRHATRAFSKYAGAFLGFLSALVVIYGFYYLFVVSDYLKVQTIQVVGIKKYVNANDVLTVSNQKALGQSIVFYNINSLSSILKNTFLGIKSVKVSKRYPSQLIVFVQERTVVALMHKPDSSEYYLIDDEGFVLGVTNEKEQDLPLVVYEDDLMIGKYIRPDLVPAYLEIYQSFNDKSVKFSSLSFSENYVSLFLPDNIRVFIGHDKKKKEAINVITDLLVQLKIEGKKPNKIDLRYDKVIVEY